MYYCIGWDKQKITTIELMYYKITKGLSRFHEKDTLVNFCMDNSKQFKWTLMDLNDIVT